MPTILQPQAGTTLSAEKTATGFLQERTSFTWDLDKAVTPDSVTVATGACATVTYTLTATRTAGPTTTVAGVTGQICVTNGGEVATENLRIEDRVQVNTGGGTGFVDIPGATQTIIPAQQLAPGETRCFTYNITFTPVPGAQQYRNVAHVTITNHSGHLGEPFGPEVRESFDLPAVATPVTVDASATVTDDETCPGGFTCTPSNPGPFVFNNTGSVQFTKTICNILAPCGTTTSVDDTATLTTSDTGTTTTASASVTVLTPACPEGTTITATKTASGQLLEATRFLWTLDKQALNTPPPIPRGECATVNYQIVVTRTPGPTERVARMEGLVCVTNTGTQPTQGLRIVDRVQVNFGLGFVDIPGATVTLTPPQIPAGQTQCFPITITFTPPAAGALRNLAEVTITNFSGSIGTPTGPTVTADFTLPEEPVRTEIDATAVVSDLEICPTGFTCTPSDPGPFPVSGSTTISFTKQVCNVSACLVTTSLDDTATLVTSDTGTTVSDSASVPIVAPQCPGPPPPSQEIDCIRTEKVYDFCFEQDLGLQNCVPIPPNCSTPPAGSTASCTITNVTCTAGTPVPIPGQDGFSSVRKTVVITYTVTIRNAAGTVICTIPNQQFTFTRSVVLCAPVGTTADCEAFATCGNCVILPPADDLVGAEQVDRGQVCCEFNLCAVVESVAPVKLLVPVNGFCIPAPCRTGGFPPFPCPPLLFPPQCPPDGNGDGAGAAGCSGSDRT